MRSCCTTDGTVATGNHSSVSRSLKDQPEDRDCTSLVILKYNGQYERVSFCFSPIYTPSPTVLIDKPGEPPVSPLTLLSLLGKLGSPGQKWNSVTCFLYYCNSSFSNTVSNTSKGLKFAKLQSCKCSQCLITCRQCAKYIILTCIHQIASFATAKNPSSSTCCREQIN